MFSWSRCIALIAIVVPLLSSPALATDVVSRALVIPAVGRTDGVTGTKWRTDVVVTNMSRRMIQVPVAIALVRGSEPEEVLSIDMEPRSTVVLQDVLKETFGLESAFGLIEVVPLSAEAQLTAYARVYNVGSGKGEFGQVVPAVANAKLPRESFLSGLKGVGGKRTNVGISNPTDETVLAFLTLYEASGEQRTSFSMAIPPRTVSQLNDVFRYFATGPLDGAMVQINASAGVYTYASIVDAQSGDADFVAGSAIDAPAGPPCVSPAPLHLSPTPDKGWIVVFRPGTGAVRETDAMAARYGFVPDKIFETLPAFFAELPESVVAAIRCDVTVAYVSQNGRI